MQLVLGIALETIAKFSQIEEEEKDALSFGFVFYWNPSEVIRLQFWISDMLVKA